MTTRNVTIRNCSKQMIPLYVLPPKGDFYIHGQNIYLSPGKSTTIPESYLNTEQIKNLQQARRITLRNG